jgi:hypothetical protein
MNQIPCVISGNVCFPCTGPDFQYATPLEVAAWGACLSVAVVLCGVAYRARRSSQFRLNLSLFVALIFFVASSIIALGSRQRGMVVGIEKNREDVERIKQIQIQRQSSKDGEISAQQPKEKPSPNKP